MIPGFGSHDSCQFFHENRLREVFALVCREQQVPGKMPSRQTKICPKGLPPGVSGLWGSRAGSAGRRTGAPSNCQVRNSLPLLRTSFPFVQRRARSGRLVMLAAGGFFFGFRHAFNR